MRSFGLLIAAHGNLAKSVLESLEMLMGPQENTETVGLFPGMGSDDMRIAMEQKLDLLSGCANILIAADLVGGTPANVAAELVALRPNLQLVGGFNMAFLCELAASDDLDESAIEDWLEAGTFGMQDVGKRLRGLLGDNPVATTAEDDF